MSDLDALQSSLADEHAALYLFGLYGARVSASGAPAVFAGLDDGYREHRRQRDGLERLIRDLNAEPVAAAVAYEVSGPIETVEEVTEHARATETECAKRYAWLVAEAVDAEIRSFAVSALTSSAVRLTALGAEPTAFPGT